MKIGFIGVGKLGQKAAEVMAEKHEVVGYDINNVSPSNFEMVATIKEHVKIEKLSLLQYQHHIIQTMTVGSQQHIYLIKILIMTS